VRARDEGGLISVYEYPYAESLDELRPRSAQAAAPDDGADAAADLDRRTVLQLSGDVIAAVERAINLSSAESFTAHFRAVRAELADDYPFLPSLSACVEYTDGAAQLRRTTDVRQFVAGICLALQRVVERVAARDTAGRGVRREVARALATLAERRPKALARFGFATQLERIAGLRWT
jgi:hypothetical protein